MARLRAGRRKDNRKNLHWEYKHEMVAKVGKGVNDQRSWEAVIGAKAMLFFDGNVPRQRTNLRTSESGSSHDAILLTNDKLPVD